MMLSTYHQTDNALSTIFILSVIKVFMVGMNYVVRYFIIRCRVEIPHLKTAPSKMDVCLRWSARLHTRMCLFRHIQTDSKAKKVDLYSDPSTELQQWLKIPLFREHEKPFKPEKKIIEQAQNLFKLSNNHEIKFLKSVVNPEDYPIGNKPEILFLGQSNAGKSSLIQAIFENLPKLVKTSKKPGHTKTLNFFQVGNKFNLVDAPGYGINQPDTFIPSVERYLKCRPNLQRTFVLIDGVAGFTEWDLIAFKMLQEFSRPYALIMTKIDLMPASQRLNNLIHMQQIRDKYSSPFCFPQPFLLSNKTLEGIGYLQAFIAYITFNIEINGL